MLGWLVGVVLGGESRVFVTVVCCSLLLACVVSIRINFDCLSAQEERIHFISFIQQQPDYSGLGLSGTCIFYSFNLLKVALCYSAETQFRTTVTADLNFLCLCTQVLIMVSSISGLPIRLI